jgi:RNA polymerase sigma-70 factor (sigma-E family)
MKDPEGFREFVAARSAALVRSACLLTGDEGTAQDLVQATLIRTWSRWPRVARQDAPEAYVRKVMLSIFLSWSRRRWRGEIPTSTLPDSADTGDHAHDVAVRLAVAVALRELPARQRAVVVLRYFDDFTGAQTAHALGCSIGTVKSQASKALARLRQSPSLGDLFVEGMEVPHDAR